jgi:hypothetical protein
MSVSQGFTRNTLTTVESFFENGGDFGRPFFELPLAHRIAQAHSAQQVIHDSLPYIQGFAWIDPSIEHESPQIMVANDALHNALSDTHRAVVEQYNDTHEAVSKLFVFGTAGVKALSELVGSRVIVVELAAFGAEERALHESVSQKAAPSWYVRTNAVMSDVAHIFKEDVITEAGVSELQNKTSGNSITKKLPPTVVDILADQTQFAGRRVEKSEFFDRISALQTTPDVRDEAFRSADQVLLAGSFMRAVNDRINVELREAYQEVLSEEVSDEQLPVEVVEDIFRKLKAPILGSLAISQQVDASNNGVRPAALLVPISTISACRSAMAQDELHLVAIGEDDSFVSFWWQDKHMLTVVPSSVDDYIWVRFDEARPDLTYADKKAVQREFNNYIRQEQNVSFS